MSLIVVLFNTLIYIGMGKLFDSKGKRIDIVESSAMKGGEGVVYQVRGNTSTVVKVYRKGKGNFKKLRAMVQSQPLDPMRDHGLTSIAWPTKIIYDESRDPSGFLMPSCSGEKAFSVIAPGIRKKRYPNISHKNLIRIGYNLAASMAAIHDQKCFVSDVNEENVLVDPDNYTVAWIDCDSYHIVSNKETFRCTVYRPSHTPPEHQGKTPETYDTTIYHDRFGLSVLLFQLLMEGVHPFEGSGPGKVHERIKTGDWPYDTKNGRHIPRQASPDIGILNYDLRKYFRQCFLNGYHSPSLRPSCRDWMNVLEKAESKTQQCPHVSSHTYSDHLSSCPWCQREDMLRSGFSGGKTQSVPVSFSSAYKSKSKKGHFEDILTFFIYLKALFVSYFPESQKSNKIYSRKSNNDSICLGEGVDLSESSVDIKDRVNIKS